MHVHHAIFHTLLPVVWISMATAQSLDPRLDTPDDAQATAAYRAILAVAARNGGQQEQMARVKFCSPGAGRPGVVCAVAIKTSATTAERGLTIYFSRGPDSAWVAEIE